MPSQFDGFFKFYRSLSGKTIRQPEVLRLYKTHCKKRKLQALSNQEVIAAFEQMGGVRVLDGKNISWKVGR